jgi:hypothetical protein
LFFWKLFSSAKQIQENPKKCLKALKIHRKSRKIPKDRLRHEQSNKVFGVHEKDFRAPK